MHRDVEEHEHSRGLDERQPARAGGVAGDVVPDREKVGRRPGARRRDAGPQSCNGGLLGSAGHAVRFPDQFHLVQIGGVTGAGQRRRRRRQVLRGRQQRQRRGVLKMGEGRVRVGRRRLLPASRELRFRVRRERRDHPPVGLPPGQDFAGDGRTDRGAEADEARRIGPDTAGECGVVSRHRRGVDGHEHVVGRLRRRGFRRSASVPQPDAVWLEHALERVDRVEHRDVRQREEAGGQRVLRRRDGVLKNLVPFENDVGGRMLAHVRQACPASTAPTPGWPQSVVFCAWKISLPGKAPFGGQSANGREPAGLLS